MKLMTWTRACFISFGAVLLMALLTGCGNPNGGQRLAEEFDAWLVENPYPGMTVGEVSTTEALPYVGSATINLLLAGDATAEDLDRAMQHVCPFEGDGSTNATFRVTADGISVPVQCADTAPWTGVWESLSKAPGLHEADIGDVQNTFRFPSAKRLPEGLTALRSVDWATLDVDRLTVSVGGQDSADEWVLFEDIAASKDAKQVVVDALNTGITLAQISVRAGNENSDEGVLVSLASPDRKVLKRMKTALVGSNPERRGLIRVTA